MPKVAKYLEARLLLSKNDQQRRPRSNGKVAKTVIEAVESYSLEARVVIRGPPPTCLPVKARWLRPRSSGPRQWQQPWAGQT